MSVSEARATGSPLDVPPQHPGASVYRRGTRRRRAPFSLPSELAELQEANPRLAAAVTAHISRLNVENARWRTELRKAERRIMELETRVQAHDE